MIRRLKVSMSQGQAAQVVFAFTEVRCDYVVRTYDLHTRSVVVLPRLSDDAD